MSVEIAWKQNILVTDFQLLKSLLLVFGFGSQAFVCGFSRQNICSVWFSILTKVMVIMQTVNDKGIVFHVIFVNWNWSTLDEISSFLRQTVAIEKTSSYSWMPVRTWICDYSCNKKTTTQIQISRLNWNCFFSNISHQIMI